MDFKQLSSLIGLGQFSVGNQCFWLSCLAIYGMAGLTVLPMGLLSIGVLCSFCLEVDGPG